MSVLKISVIVGFVLLALFSVSHAACWHGKNEPGVDGCQDFEDKTWHEFGSSWKNSKCSKCWCNPDFIRCCHGWPTSVSAGCSIEYDYSKCTYKITNNANPGAPCAASGK
ncbi:beta-microseminoprotein-like [Silurus meridionalis]|uniref:Beta-microseminoprotein n=1 Tax=Silurus meridionalis TaxID=175797 RepID=A0A8T0B8E0_SILME|nr:beta-microseminoprotein-like [Silurus meridionalis]KAF7700870.1 hypothetical protein HF521_002035 [Silurus meridionalis]